MTLQAPCAGRPGAGAGDLATVSAALAGVRLGKGQGAVSAYRDSLFATAAHTCGHLLSRNLPLPLWREATCTSGPSQHAEGVLMLLQYTPPLNGTRHTSMCCWWTQEGGAEEQAGGGGAGGQGGGQGREHGCVAVGANGA
jgi:hypothetical protein